MNPFGKAISAFINLTIYLLFPLSILGVWKFIEIIIWLIHYISIGIK